MNDELIKEEIKKMLNDNVSRDYITNVLSKKYNTTKKSILYKIKIVANDIYNKHVYGRELTEKIFKSIEENGLDIDGDLTLVDGNLYFVDYYNHMISRIG